MISKVWTIILDILTKIKGRIKWLPCAATSSSLNTPACITPTIVISSLHFLNNFRLYSKRIQKNFFIPFFFLSYLPSFLSSQEIVGALYFVVREAPTQNLLFPLRRNVEGSRKQLDNFAELVEKGMEKN